MKRNEFLKKGLIGAGGVVTFGGIALSNPKNDTAAPKTSVPCLTSPKETRGPFPNKVPSAYTFASIVGDRKGIPLSIVLTVLGRDKGCKPLSNVWVDIWHCDAAGQYSEYGGYGLQSRDLTAEHFLRGRQASDNEGRVLFESIFPGYYPGRAPHVHIEVLSKNGTSILATQIAFPKTFCDAVYASEHYSSTVYTSNESDMVFRDSLEQNMADSIEGSTKNGLTLHKTIIVP